MKFSIVVALCVGFISILKIQPSSAIKCYQCIYAEGVKLGNSLTCEKRPTEEELEEYEEIPNTGFARNFLNEAFMSEVRQMDNEPSPDTPEIITGLEFDTNDPQNIGKSSSTYCLTTTGTLAGKKIVIRHAKHLRRDVGSNHCINGQTSDVPFFLKNARTCFCNKDKCNGKDESGRGSGGGKDNGNNGGTTVSSNALFLIFMAIAGVGYMQQNV